VDLGTSSQPGTNPRREKAMRNEWT
jgi:hypothetical protein